MRIVSLLPSATELVCALGAASELVGISHECDFPEAIRDRPVLTRSRIDAGASSAAIDLAVRDVLKGALSIYAVDEALLASLSPEVIVTQDLCEVCAVSLDDVRAAVARIAHRAEVQIVSLSPTRLGDVLDDVSRVALAIGRESIGAVVREELSARIAAIAARASSASASRPRVASLEWIDPLMLGGTWMPELIELAGGVAIGAVAGAPAPTVTSAQLRALEPDVVVVKPCGFSLARALEERAVLERALAGTTLTRAAVFELLGGHGIDTAGQRGIHILWQLSQEGVLCFSAHEGKQPAFALLDDWVPASRLLARDEALARLAARYIGSHGPASAADLAYWSGLTLGDARTGLAAADGLEQHGDYWTAHSATARAGRNALHLLPGFDEYLLGYKDRSAVLDPAHAPLVVPGGNGMFKPMIVHGGRIVGTWQRAAADLAPQGFATLSAAQNTALTKAAVRYHAFWGDEA